MHIRTTFTFATLGLGALSTAIAGPTGGVVVGGQGAISTPSATTTVVDQASQNLQVNWNTFNVAANENVQFHQPSSSSVAFNRILDQNPSQIFGRIDANGQVVLVNPNGLLIGRSAQLNVNSLVASSLDAIDFDAASGRYRFSTSRLEPGAVINGGSITAGPGGSVTLLGGHVSNSGSIVADYGNVNLAAGRAATLDLAGDGLLRLEVGADLLTNGSGAVAAVDNSGSIQANGGQVLLTANAVRDVFANLVNNTGVVRANRIDNSGGTIRLMGPEGTVLSSGTLDASAGDAVSTGGSVAMLGERVGLMGSAVVDVSGATGGGTALIGGDYQGKNPDVLNARRTYVGVDATINVDAGRNGDGGRVIVWSDDFTRFDGNLSARGGSLSGNGGFAEVSGKQSLAFTGGVNMTAAHGAWGTLLLDPDDIIITSSLAAPPAELTDDGTYTFAEGTSTVNLGIGAIATQLITTDVILQANNNITQNAALDVASLEPSAHGSLTFTTASPAGTIALGDIAMNTGGSLTVNAGGALTLGGVLQTSDRPIKIDANSISMSGSGQIFATGSLGTVKLHALTGAISLGGLVATNGGSVDVAADNSTITMVGVPSAITAVSGDITLSAQGDVTPTTLATSGAVSVTSTNGNIVAAASTILRAGTLTLSANGGTTHHIGTSSGRIDTDAQTLIATASSGVFVNEQDDITLGDVNAGNGEIAVGAGGSILVGANKTVQSTNGPITLAATNTLSMGGGSAITAGNSGTITLSGHDAVVTGVRSLTGTVNITSNGGDIEDVASGSVIQANTLNLTANGGDIGAVADFDIDAATLNATASRGIRVKDQNVLTLAGLNAGAQGASVTAGNTLTVGTNAQLKTTGGGALSLTSTTGSFDMGSSSLIDAGSGAITLHAPFDVSVGDIRTTGSATITSDFGNIVDTAPGKPILAGALELNAPLGQVGLGAFSRIETTASSLEANAAHGVYITETNDLTLDTISTGTGGLTLTAGGNITVGAGKVVSATNVPVSITSNNGAIDMDSASEINSGSADVTLVAHDDVTVSKITTTGAANVSVTSTNGDILDDPTANTLIRANGLTLSAATGKIGDSAAGAEIDTDVATLSASSAHGAHIGDAGALTVTNLGAGDGAVVMVANGDIGVTAVSTTNSATISSMTGNVVKAGASLIQANALTLNATAGRLGDVGTGNELNTDVQSLKATALHGVYINEASGLALDDVDAGDAAFNLTAGNAITVGAGKTVQTANAPVSITATTGGIAMGNASAINAGSGAVTLNGASDIRVSKIDTTGDVAVTSTSGNIVDDPTANTLIKANGLTLSAATGKIGDSAAGAEIDTDVATLSASSAHGANIGDAGALTVTNLGAGDGAIVMVANGNIGVTAVSTTDSATITSTTGNITKAGASLIQANALTLNATAGAIGNATAGNDLSTDVQSLKAAAAHGVYISEASGLALDDVDAGDAAFNLTAGDAITVGAGKTLQTTNAPVLITATTGGISMGNASAINAGNGAVTLNGASDVRVSKIDTTANVALTSTSGNIVDDPTANTLIKANALTLNAAAGRLGDVGTGNELDTDVQSLKATALHGAYISEANGLALDDVDAGDAAFNLTAGNAISVGAGKTLQTTNAPVSITATTGGISMGNASAINAGSGAVTLSGASDVRVSKIDTTGNVALTSTSGNIVDDPTTDTLIKANELTLSAAAGKIGDSATGAEIDTDVATLLVTAAHGAYIGDAGSLTVTAIAAGDGAIAMVANGDIGVTTVSTTNSATITSTTGSVVKAGASLIQANALTLNATAGRLGDVGTGNELNTDVQSLKATALHGVYINEASGLALDDVDAGDAAFNLTAGNAITVGAGKTLQTTNAPVSITAMTGGIAMGNASAINAGSGAVTLNGASDIRVSEIDTTGDVAVTSTSGNIVDDPTANTLIKANGLTLSAAAGKIGDSATGAEIDTDLATLLATAAHGAYIGDAGSLTVTTIAAGDGAIAMVANGNIAVTAVSTTDSATITSTTGNITRAGASLIQANALTLNATAGAIGNAAAGNELSTDVQSLKAAAAHGVYISEASGLALDDVDAGDAAFNLTAGNAITVGAGKTLQTTNAPVSITATTGGISMGNASAISAGSGAVTLNGVSDVRVSKIDTTGNVALTSTSGNIVDDPTANTLIKANELTLSAAAGKIGDSAAGAEIDTDVATLSVTAAHGAYIGDAGSLTATTIAAGDGAVALTAAGSVAVGDITTTDNAAVTSTSGNITRSGGGTIQANALTLAAAAGAIGAVGGSEMSTNVSALKATALHGAFVNELDGVTLDDVSAGDGGFDLTAGAGIVVGAGKALTAANAPIRLAASTGAISMGAGSSIGAGSGAVTLTAQGDVGVTDITTTDTVSVTSSTGNILDDSVQGTLIRAGALMLSATAGAIGGSGANADIDTQVSSVGATAGNGVYLHELDGIALNSVTTTSGDITVSSDTGDLLAGTVTAAGVVTLAATTGAITDDNNNATLVAGAGGVSLTAGTGVGTITDFATASGSSIDVQTSGALTALVASNTGQVNLNISGAPTLAAGAITLGSGTGRGGAVILQSAGNLDVAGLTAGAIIIGAGNTTSVGLVSDAVLTLPTVGGFTDAPASSLLVRGVTDVVDNDASPRELAFTANALNFQSGAAGGATVLDTTVNRLDATIGNSKDLTVNETDGLTLGTLFASNIALTAGGAVADDNDDSTRITAIGGLTLAGTSLGAAGNELDTDALTLNATASAGGIFAREASDLLLTAHATGGAVDVRTGGGALAVTAATGAGVTLTSGTGDLVAFGAIDGGSGPVNLTAIGINGSVTLASTLNTTGDVTLTAGPSGAIVAASGNHISAHNLTVTGAAIANGSQRLNTSVDTLTGTAQNGGIYVTEDDALSLTATATGGPVDAMTTNGTLAVTSASGTGIALLAGGAGNAIAVNGAVNGGSGDITLVTTGAGGRINLNDTLSTTGNVLLQAGDAADRGAITSNGSQVAGNVLFALGSSIGTSGSQLNTAVTSLSAIGTNGGVYIQEADGLDVSAGGTGPVQVATLNGTLNVSSVSGDGGVTLAAGGAGNDLIVNGGVSGGTGPVMLTADGGMTLNGVVGTAGNVTLTTTGAGSTLALNSIVAADQLTINAGPASARGAIVAGAGSQLAANAATLRGSAIGASTARLNTTVGSLDAQTTNGGLFISEADGLTLTAATTNGALDVRTASGTLTVGSAVAGSDVTLESGDAIVAGANSNVAANTVNLTGSSIGSSVARVNTTATSLNVTSTNGAIFINEADGVALTGNATGGALDVQAGGALAVTSAAGNGVTLTATGAGAGIAVNGAINAGAGNATLTAGSSASRGTITAGAGSQISAASLTVTGSGIGAAASRLNTSVGSLTATSTNGGTYIAETDALTLAASASGGALDVQTGNGALTVSSARGTGVILAAGGAGSGIVLNGAVDAGNGDVTLTAGTTTSRGAITGGAQNLVTGTTLTAGGSSVGSALGAVNTNIDTLNADASTGDVYVREQSGLGLANVRAGGKVDVAAASGNLTVSSVRATGDVSLNAGSGAIVDDGDDTTRLAGKNVTLLARSIGTASTLTGTTLDSRARLDIDATSLDATSTAGGIFIDSLNGLASTSLHASGGADGDIELLTANGDLNLLSVSASDTLLLAAARNIYGLRGLAKISARAAELRAGGADSAEGHIGTLSQPLSLQLDAGSTLRLFVPQTVDPNDPARAPSTLPSAGVTSTLSFFGAPDVLALQAGFGQFQGLGDTQFTSPAEALVRSIQNQTATTQSVLGLDWASFDPNVSLFGTLDPSVCLPGDQRDEEQSASGC